VGVRVLVDPLLGQESTSWSRPCAPKAPRRIGIDAGR
jgi:hypothetical protein